MDVSHQHEQARGSAQSGPVSLPLGDEHLRLAIINGLAVSPDPEMNDALVERLSQLLHPILANYQQKIDDQLEGIDASIKSLSTRHLITKDDAVQCETRARFSTNGLDGLEEKSLRTPERKERKSVEDRLKHIESSLSALLKRVEHLESCRASRDDRAIIVTTSLGSQTENVADGRAEATVGSRSPVHGSTFFGDGEAGYNSVEPPTEEHEFRAPSLSPPSTPSRPLASIVWNVLRTAFITPPSTRSKSSFEISGPSEFMTPDVGESAPVASITSTSTILEDSPVDERASPSDLPKPSQLEAEPLGLDTRALSLLNRPLSPLSSLTSFSDDDEKTSSTLSDSKTPQTRKRRAKTSGVSPLAKRTRRKVAPPTAKTDSKVQWPMKNEGDEAFRRKFIRCDLCHSWYHYGCVDIFPGDVRLEPTVIYICPVCNSQSHKQSHHLTSNDPSQTCARPDCHQSATGEYFVERIVGRVVKRFLDPDSGEQLTYYYWLIKWDGYPIEQATWESGEQIVDPEHLVQAFNIAAKKEGFDLNLISTIILKEAQGSHAYH